MSIKRISITATLILIFIYLFHFALDGFIKNPTPISQMHQSNWSMVQYVTDNGYKIVEVISKCNYFPRSFAELYSEDNLKKANSKEDCKPLKDPTKYPTLSPARKERFKREFPDYKPWIDPWGRPYQIRYDRDRRKLQVRSQGRYLWWPWDNIVDETTWGMAGSFFNEEIKKCDSLPRDDMSCIFNRGWH